MTSCSKDQNLKALDTLLKKHDIFHGSDRYSRLRDFLLNEKNSVFLQSFMIMCSGALNERELKIRLEEIIKDAEFPGITFRELFSMDPEWVDYFSENAYPLPSGQPRIGDQRMGVDRSYVQNVMTNRDGPPLISLEAAIIKTIEDKISRET
jgi:hypothetical protein